MAIGQAFDALLASYAPLVRKLSSDGGMEDVLMLCAELIACDRSQQDHPLVISCLRAAEQQVREAAFNVYASYK